MDQTADDLGGARGERHRRDVQHASTGRGGRDKIYFKEGRRQAGAQTLPGLSALARRTLHGMRLES